MSKESTFTFRVPEELKKTFEETSAARDMSASQELRAFMRWYVKEHAQADLFKKSKGK